MDLKEASRVQLTLHGRRAVVRELAMRYKTAAKKEKGRILDQVAILGYNRYYAARALRRYSQTLVPSLLQARPTPAPTSSGPPSAGGQRIPLHRCLRSARPPVTLRRYLARGQAYPVIPACLRPPPGCSPIFPCYPHPSPPGRPAAVDALRRQVRSRFCGTMAGTGPGGQVMISGPRHRVVFVPAGRQYWRNVYRGTKRGRGSECQKSWLY